MSSVKHYHTRTAANNGAKLFLLDPVTNEQTQDWLHVLGFESDTFREAMFEKQRAVAAAQTLADPEAREDAKNTAVNNMLVSLVTDWSFDEDFSAAAVAELFAEAPYIRAAVDTFASQRANFTDKQPKS